MNLKDVVTTCKQMTTCVCKQMTTCTCKQMTTCTCKQMTTTFDLFFAVVVVGYVISERDF